MAGLRLTIRHGSRVERERFDDLGDAVAAMERHAERIRAEGPLEGAKMLREFEPGERVAARIEISAGGRLRRRDAGVDVMGDGRVVPFAGGVRRRELSERKDKGPYDAVRRALS